MVCGNSVGTVETTIQDIGDSPHITLMNIFVYGTNVNKKASKFGSLIFYLYICDRKKYAIDGIKEKGMVNLTIPFIFSL